MQDIIKTTQGVKTHKLKFVAEASEQKSEQIAQDFINNRGFVSGMDTYEVTPSDGKVTLKQGNYELILINRNIQ